MFESHYLKPFVVSLGITTMLISGMGLSLRGMAGTGAAHDAAEISFNLPDDGESDTGVDTAPKPAENPMEKPQNVIPEGAAPKGNSLVNERKPEEERTKELSESTAASSVRREWTVPKAIESERVAVNKLLLHTEQILRMENLPRIVKRLSVKR